MLFYQLRRIKSSVRALPTEAAKAVVNSFVVSRIDYCNDLVMTSVVLRRVRNCLRIIIIIIKNARWRRYFKTEFDEHCHCLHF